MKKRIIVALLAAVVLAVVLSIGTLSTLAEDKNIRGDVNGDGSVNVCDCVYICIIASGKKADNGKADIDYDGIITTKDAEILANYIAKLRPELPKDPKDLKDSEIETEIIKG